MSELCHKGPTGINSHEIFVKKKAKNYFQTISQLEMHTSVLAIVLGKSLFFSRFLGNL